MSEKEGEEVANGYQTKNTRHKYLKVLNVHRPIKDPADKSV